MHLSTTHTGVSMLELVSTFAMQHCSIVTMLMAIVDKCGALAFHCYAWALLNIHVVSNKCTWYRGPKYFPSFAACYAGP